MKIEADGFSFDFSNAVDVFDKKDKNPTITVYLMP